MITQTDVNGTYRAKVEMLGPDGNWYSKRGQSSFFPDNWTPQRVDESINEAFRNRKPHPLDPNKRAGKGNGPDIEGFYNRQGSRWESAWPRVGE